MMENRGYPFMYEDSEWELSYVFLDETIQLRNNDHLVFLLD